MKMMILLEVDISKTMADTMERSGFVLAPDGSNMQIKIPNAPPIPQRKVKTAFVRNPTQQLKIVKAACMSEPSSSV